MGFFGGSDHGLLVLVVKQFGSLPFGCVEGCWVVGLLRASTGFWQGVYLVFDCLELKFSIDMDHDLLGFRPPCSAV